MQGPERMTLLKSAPPCLVRRCESNRPPSPSRRSKRLSARKSSRSGIGQGRRTRSVPEEIKFRAIAGSIFQLRLGALPRRDADYIMPSSRAFSDPNNLLRSCDRRGRGRSSRNRAAHNAAAVREDHPLSRRLRAPPPRSRGPVAGRGVKPTCAPFPAAALPPSMGIMHPEFGIYLPRPPRRDAP